MLERGLNNVKQNVKFYVTSIFSHVMEPFRPTGIANDDNSCYLNSVLQLLLSSACIRDRLSRLTEFDHGGVLISTVKEIFCQMLSTENFFINASTSSFSISAAVYTCIRYTVVSINWSVYTCIRYTVVSINCWSVYTCIRYTIYLVQLICVYLY